MPTGRNEFFNIKIKPDRAQRKTLDAFLGRAQEAVAWIFSEQKSAVQAGVPSRPEELVERALAEHDLHRETLKDACDIALERLKLVLGGDIVERGRRGAQLFAVDGSEVLFSTMELKVRVPYLGVCSYVRNKKILVLEKGAGAQLSMKAHRVVLGYLNQEPVLQVDTVDRTPKREDFSGQKLVKVVRGHRPSSS